jgi:predicted nucleic acid-binding protein
MGCEAVRRRRCVRCWELRSARIRIGSSDLKIAAICLANGATPLSGKLTYFKQVPGIHVEHWLA